MSKTITFRVFDNIESFFYGIFRLLRLGAKYISLAIKFVLGFVLEIIKFIVHLIEYLIKLTLPVIGLFLLWISYQVLQVMTAWGIQCIGEDIGLMLFFLCSTLIGIHTLKYGLAEVSISKFPRFRWY